MTDDEGGDDDDDAVASSAAAAVMVVVVVDDAILKNLRLRTRQNVVCAGDTWCHVSRVEYSQRFGVVLAAVVRVCVVFPG